MLRVFSSPQKVFTRMHVTIIVPTVVSQMFLYLGGPSSFTQNSLDRWCLFIYLTLPFPAQMICRRLLLAKARNGCCVGIHQNPRKHPKIQKIKGITKC
eukprot:1296863-Amphidinium_carterae.1